MFLKLFLKIESHKEILEKMDYNKNDILERILSNKKSLLLQKSRKQNLIIVFYDIENDEYYYGVDAIVKHIISSDNLDEEEIISLLHYIYQISWLIYPREYFLKTDKVLRKALLSIS